MKKLLSIIAIAALAACGGEEAANEGEATTQTPETAAPATDPAMSGTPAPAVDPAAAPVTDPAAAPATGATTDPAATTPATGTDTTAAAPAAPAGH